MSTAHLHIGSFNAGEISPLMGARFQVEKVANGCRKLRNFIIHPHGPAFRRPGMEYMGAAATSATASNLRSFQFSASTVFVLELSTAGLRVWQNGALVSLLAPVVLPYSATEMPNVQMCQVNDVVYLAHPNHEPRKLIRYADDDWRLEAMAWKWPPLLDENPGSVALPITSEIMLSYDFTPYLNTGTEFKLMHGVTQIGLSPTPPAGPKRLIIERMHAGNGWVVTSDQSWTGSYPAEHPVTSLTSVAPGTPVDRYRFKYHGPAYSGFIVIEDALADSDAKSLASTIPPAPTSVILPVGNYRYSFVVPDQTAESYIRKTATIKLRESVPGSGIWSDIASHSVSAGLNISTVFAVASPTEIRFEFDGFLQPMGECQAIVEDVTSVIPARTSLMVSDPTAGSGRTLTASRSLFRAGHIGAFWQLTHRRDDAFVELNPTSAAVSATATLTLASVAVAAATVTIGSRVYTWATSVTTVANTVAIGANATASCANLAAAINAGAGAGSTYGSATAPHADVTALAIGSTVVITARNPGEGAHTIPVTETMTNGSWSSVFLSGGVNANTVIGAAETVGLIINGKWDVLTYGSWATTLYLERLNASDEWEFVRSWRSNKDRNVAAQGETDGVETLRLRIIAGTASESSNAASPRFVLEATDGRLDGLVRITEVGTLDDGQSLTATCDVIIPCLSDDPTYIWTEGAWSLDRGFPAAVALHENRLWFAGTKMEPMRLWASVTGDIENFRRTSLDDGSLSFTPSAGELNPIQWIISQGADLILGTKGDEWSLNGEGKPITPSNVMLRPQSRFGSSTVAAIMASEVVVFVQRGGRKVRRITQRSNNEPWSTSDMTVLAEHIALTGIKQLAFGSNPNAILWAVTTDGKLLGMTLEVEQNVFGWHVHETDGIIESVAVVYGVEADEVWLSVLRGSARSIERLDTRVFSRDFTEYQTMMFCDAAVRFEGSPSAVFTGLEHLNGKEVVCLADGVDIGTLTVIDGMLSLADAVSTLVVGLPFTSEVQPSRMEVQTEKGSAQGMLWRVSRVSAYVHESQGGQVAENPSSRFESLPYQGTALYSGDLETSIESTARRSVDVVVKSSAPLPLNIGSLTLKLDLYGD